jgi:hypothetical protein
LRRMPRVEIGAPELLFGEFINGVKALPVKVVR